MERLLSSLNVIYFYLKPYESHTKKRKEKIRYYDEKEWRYVPDLEAYEVKLNEINIIMGRINEFDFDNKDIRSKANSIIEKATLSFNHDDIKYIIVKKEDERLKMITQLEQIKHNKYSGSNIIKVLSSRILTCEQIKKDF